MRLRSCLSALLFGAAALAHADTESPNALYFYTYIKHLDPTPQTNENLRWLGYSRTLQHEQWRFVTGGATYVDSYHVRSYAAFSDISYDAFTLPLLRPALSLQCQYKGKEYTSTKHQFICFPLPKLKFGGDNGLMANLAGAPKLGTLTNGWITLEFAWQW